MSVFLCFFKYKGVHLQLSLQINGAEAEQQSSQILKAFLFRFSLRFFFDRFPYVSPFWLNVRFVRKSKNLESVELSRFLLGCGGRI